MFCVAGSINEKDASDGVFNICLFVIAFLI